MFPKNYIDKTIKDLNKIKNNNFKIEIKKILYEIKAYYVKKENIITQIDQIYVSQ